MTTNLSPTERALLNEEAMHDDTDRIFCGLELGPLTISARRYVERMIYRYSTIKASPRESALGYAFLLTKSLNEMRKISREIDDFEREMDKWLQTLPDPVPEEELARLENIVARDMQLIEAALVEIAPKPGPALRKPAHPQTPSAGPAGLGGPRRGQGVRP